MGGIEGGEENGFERRQGPLKQIVAGTGAAMAEVGRSGLAGELQRPIPKPLAGSRRKAGEGLSASQPPSSLTPQEALLVTALRGQLLVPPPYRVRPTGLRIRS
ncbi:hypothetical protein M758_UG007500 [Ceratodon purpureus]|nr:hypothetical protein M758_UG007500 [Ceratodon purpureus]